MKQELAIKKSMPTSPRCVAAESSIRDTVPNHPHCEVGGCIEEPTMAQQHEKRGFIFFCDRHREDKRLAYQRNANWRHKLKTRHGIILPWPTKAGA